MAQRPKGKKPAAPGQLDISLQLVEVARRIAEKHGLEWAEGEGGIAALYESRALLAEQRVKKAAERAAKAEAEAAAAVSTREATATELDRLRKEPSKESSEVRVAEIEAATARYKTDVEREVNLRKIEADERANADKEKSALAIERLKADSAKAIEEIRKEAAKVVEETRSAGVVRVEGVKGKYVVLAAVITGLAGAVGGYLAARRSEPNPSSGSQADAGSPMSDGGALTPGLSACERSANGKAYVLKAVTLFANLEIDSPKAPKRMDLDMRIVYSVKALRDIPRNDPAFVEQYTFRYAKSFEPWFGTERTIHTDGDNYQIVLDLRSGEERTISTGARFHYEWPMKDRKFFNDLMSFAPDEFAVMYPNKDGDSICELNIIATSDSLDLLAMDESAVRINDKSQVESSFKANVVPPSEAKQPFQRSVTARWTEVHSKGTALLRFKMRPAP